MEPIPVATIVANHRAFEVDAEGGWGFHRTRLMVKDVDLYRTLLEIRYSSEVVRPSNKYIKFPTGPINQNLVVAMMPFGAEFDPVWETIQRAAYSQGMDCERADTTWKEHHIIGDIASLLWRAGITVTDYTGKNANVFYEAGVTHTLGRDAIPITQSFGDIPFDVRGIRAVEYDVSEIGLKKLELALTSRIRTLTRK